MNAYKPIFLVILLSLIFSCEKEKVLPPATKEGENTFGMLVDGKLWLPNQPALLGPDFKKPKISFYADINTLVVDARNSESNETITFGVTVNDFEKKSHYALVDMGFLEEDEFDYGCVDTTRFMYDNVCETAFFLLDSLNSSIQITRFDTVKKIVSGKFNMELHNRKGDVLSITEGRFDAPFTMQEL